jgi:hypothetical protein
MPREDVEGFLTTLGREFCHILRKDAGIPDASGHDCYSALSDGLGKPVTLEALISLKPEQFVDLAIAFNRYFETTSIKPAHVATAVSATIWHWS